MDASNWTIMLVLALLPTTLSSPQVDSQVPELSRAQSRQILRLITETLHSSQPGCPQSLLPHPQQQRQPPKNHSYLLPLDPRFESLLKHVITPASLNTSFRPDIERAVALAELLTSWITMKGLANLLVEASGSREGGNALQTLLRAFINTASFYPRYLDESATLRKRGEPTLVRNVVLCTAAKEVVVEQSSEHIQLAVASNLCTQVVAFLEGARLERVSPTNQMLGVWAPLHCNPGRDLQPGQRMPLHLIMPIPLAKSTRYIVRVSCLIVYCFPVGTHTHTHIKIWGILYSIVKFYSSKIH